MATIMQMLAAGAGVGYEDAVAWIAKNDQVDCTDLNAIRLQMTVVLVAELFNRPSATVAYDVATFRFERQRKLARQVLAEEI